MDNNVVHEDGDGQIEELSKSLLGTHMELMKYESRRWLLKSMLGRGIVTNDIYAFVTQQSNLMDNALSPDETTMKAAMRAKLKDINITLRKAYRCKKKKEDQLLHLLEGHTNRFKRKLKRIKKEVNKQKENIMTNYEKKINHLVGKQIKKIQPEPVMPTVSPNRLDEF